MASGDAHGTSRLDKMTGGDPLFWNKVSGAILAAATLAIGLNVFSKELFTSKKPAIPGYDLPAPEVAAAGATAAAPAEPLPVRLASADASKGQSAAKKCLACHAFEKGAPNKIGPVLYDTVGHPKGGHAGFNYSSAMKGKGGTWTYEDLDAFLANPKGYVPGTIMAFAGVTSPAERANILAYLQSLSEKPVEFPKP